MHFTLLADDRSVCSRITSWICWPFQTLFYAVTCKLNIFYLCVEKERCWISVCLNYADISILSVIQHLLVTSIRLLISVWNFHDLNKLIFINAAWCEAQYITMCTLKQYIQWHHFLTGVLFHLQCHSYGFGQSYGISVSGPPQVLSMRHVLLQEKENQGNQHWNQKMFMVNYLVNFYNHLSCQWVNARKT